MELENLRAVQRRCLRAYLLAARPCPCTAKLLAWYMLGIADYLMEEILIGFDNTTR